MNFSISKYFVVLLLLQGLVIACQKEPLADNPEIRLSKDEVDVPADGGETMLTYSIVNAVEGCSVSAVSDASWLGVDCAEDNLIKLSAEKNQDESVKEAVISVYYNSDKALDSIVVTQAGQDGGPGEDSPFEIKVSNIEIESALVEVIPVDSEMSYAAMSVTEEDFNKINGDNLYDGIVSYLWSLATDYGMSISDFLRTYVLTKGTSKYPLSRLYPGDTYYVIAVGMDQKAEQLSEPVYQDFMARPVDMNGATFDISYEVGRPNVKMTVVPSSDDIYYYYDALRKKDIDNMDMSLEESLMSFFRENIEYGAYLGISREEVMRDLLSKGTSSFEYTTLQASATYVGIAVSVMLEGYVNSEMTMKEFETESVIMSDNKLSLELSNINVDCVDISISTTNNDQYCMVVIESSMWPGLTPEQCMERLVEEYLLDQNTNSGNTSGTMRGLSANTEYYVLLFGYSNGRATTDLVYEVFTTREEGNPEILTFETNFSNVLSNSLSVELLPTPDNALYTATLIESSFTADDVYEYIQQTAEMYIGAGMVASLEDFLLQISVRGPQTTDFDKLYSETEYKMFAIGVYPDTGKYATDVYFSQSVKTVARTVSDVTINLQADKYFNGDEVAAGYPEHSGAKGQAVMIVRADVTGDVDKYYYHMFLDDLSDPVSAPDDALIFELTAPFGGISVPETVFYCTYGKVYTLVAVAKDRNGNFGEVFRKVVVCEEDGCSPIDEFNPSQTRRTDARNYVHRIKGDLGLKAHDTAVSLWNGPMDSASASLKPQEDDEPQLWLRMAERTQMMSAGVKKSTSGKSIVFVK